MLYFKNIVNVNVISLNLPYLSVSDIPSYLFIEVFPAVGLFDLLLHVIPHHVGLGFHELLVEDVGAYNMYI